MSATCASARMIGPIHRRCPHVRVMVDPASRLMRGSIGSHTVELTYTPVKVTANGARAFYLVTLMAQVRRAHVLNYMQWNGTVHRGRSRGPVPDIPRV